MQSTRKLTCPNCAASLAAARGIRVGKRITCPHCKIAFTVRPEDADLGGGVNATRLVIVLAVACAYLAGGAGMALYCFSHNTAEADTARPVVQTHDGNGTDDVPDLPGQAKAIAPTTRNSLSTAQQRKIDAAIAAGVWYLRDKARPGGGWVNDSVGFAALPGLTLLECGVPGNDPILQKAATLVRQQAVKRLGADAYGTYQLALAILFLDRLGQYEDDDLIRYLALCLVSGQHPDGGWHYQCPVLDREMVPELLRILQDDKQSLADWRRVALRGGTFNANAWDNSNTQFAILALWVAQRHQVAIDKTMAVVEKHFRTTQMGDAAGDPLADPDGNNLDLNGSWYYDMASARGWRNSSRWPSMTCSGLLGLAIGHGVTHDPAERKQKPLDDPAIQRGLAMLAREIDRSEEKRHPDFYYLWSLQRVGVIFDLDAFDGKDWYAWGSRILLARHDNDGSWNDGGFVGSQPILDTCFALLFLKRANLAKDLTDKLQLLASLIRGTPMPARKD